LKGCRMFCARRAVDESRFISSFGCSAVDWQQAFSEKEDLIGDP
jgi:hypothetical protein